MDLDDLTFLLLPRVRNNLKWWRNHNEDEPIRSMNECENDWMNFLLVSINIKFNPKNYKLQIETATGWLVNIYSNGIAKLVSN